MESINFNTIPHFGTALWTIIIGLAIAGAYLILEKIFLAAMAPGRAKQLLLTRLGYLEKLFWPVFMVFVGISLILSHVVAGLAVCLFVSFMLRKTINNYFLGLIYRIGKTYAIGQRIRYQDQKGTIKSFNNLTLELELEDGGFLDIPYNYFEDSTIIRTSPQSGILSHTINIPIAKPCNLEKEKQRIRALLLSLPWVLPNQKIVFEHVADEETQYLVKVIIHGIDKNHMHKVETKIMSLYRQAG